MIERLFDRWTAWMKRRGSWRMIQRTLDDGTKQDYLERYYLLSLWGYGAFIHIFHSSDMDGFHDHPWPWWRVILWGWYWERTCEQHDPIATRQIELCGPGHTIGRSALQLHYVELESETVGTLFIHGPRWREWGFVDDIGMWEPAKATTSTGPHTRGWLFPRVLA
jgi:hypothetical protein